MSHVRMAPGERKALLLGEAVKIAKANGVLAVTRASVARAVGVTPALCNRYFAGRDGLRWETIAEAGKQKMVEVVADALKVGYSRTDLEGVASKNLVARAKKLAEA
jgi:AcrR family transcriptional regulator